MNENKQIELQQPKELATIQDNLKVFKTTSETLVVTNRTQEASASDLLKRVKNYIKDIESIRTSLVKPLNDHVDFINAGFKPNVTTAKAIKESIEKKIVDFQDAETAKIKAAQEAEEKRLKAEADRLRAEAIKTNNIETLSQSVDAGKQAQVVAAAPVKIETTVKTESSTTNSRKEWTAEIIDDNLIPREYCVGDLQKVKAAVKLGKREIPGARIYEKTIITTR